MLLQILVHAYWKNAVKRKRGTHSWPLRSYFLLFLNLLKSRVLQDHTGCYASKKWLLAKPRSCSCVELPPLPLGPHPPHFLQLSTPHFPAQLLCPALASLPAHGQQMCHIKVLHPTKARTPKSNGSSIRRENVNRRQKSGDHHLQRRRKGYPHKAVQLLLCLTL